MKNFGIKDGLRIIGKGYNASDRLKLRVKSDPAIASILEYNMLFPDFDDAFKINAHVVAASSRISKIMQKAGFSYSISIICSLCIVSVFKGNSIHGSPTENLTEQKAVILSLVLLMIASDKATKRNCDLKSAILSRCAFWLSRPELNKDIFKFPRYGLSLLRQYIYATRAIYENYDFNILLDIPENAPFLRALSYIETFGANWVNLELAILPILGVKGSAEFAEHVRKLAGFYM